MSRPDDIPQDVWDEAEKWFDVAIKNIANVDRPAPNAIARAILSEREKWAKFHDEFVTLHKDGEEHAIGAGDQHAAMWHSTRWLAHMRYAQTIREGSYGNDK